MSLFGGGGVGNKTPTVHWIRVSDSQWGIPLPIVYGRARLPHHLFWMGDFEQKKNSGPGKGLGGASGSGVFYTYSESLIYAYCLGPITGFGRAFSANSGGLIRWSAAKVAAGFRESLGALGCASWPYMVSHHPGQDLGYSGVATLSIAHQDLGTSAVLYQGQLEIFGFLPYSAQIPDADASAVIQDMIANPVFGMSPGATWIDAAVSFADFTKYIAANGYFISPMFDQQKSGREWLQLILECVYADAVWSEGQLRVVPYSTDPVTGNGITWDPQVTPITDFSDDDFRLTSSTDTELTVTVVDPLLRNNIVRVEFINVLNDYNVEPFEVMDEADIVVLNRRPAPTKQYHPIPTAGMAGAIARTYLQRSLAVARKYQFQVAPTKAALLDPMDVVSLTEDFYGLAQTPVRIVSIEETGDPESDTQGRSDLEMSIICEDLSPSTALILPPPGGGPACDYGGYDRADIFFYRGTFVIFETGTFDYVPFLFEFVMAGVLAVGAPVYVLLTGPAGAGYYYGTAFGDYKSSFGWAGPPALPLLGFIDNSGVVTCPAPPPSPIAYQPPGGTGAPDPGADPAFVNAPVIIEPHSLANIPHTLWIGLSPQGDDQNWGGANIWFSDNGGTDYQQLIPDAPQPATMGLLVAPLPAHADPDTVDTLVVDLSESGGVLNTISHAQADKAYNLAYVDGEYISFADVGPGLDPSNLNEFSLTYLHRGLYGSPITAHAIGAQFLFLNSISLLDQGVAAVTYPVVDIGVLCYLKFTSFNYQGGAPQDLSTVTAYPFTPVGP